MGNNFTGINLAEFTIEGIDLEEPGRFTVDSIPDQDYTGKPIRPDVVVTDETTGAELILNQDYTVTYQDNIQPGTATAIITGMGGYTGTIQKEFQIIGTGGETYALDLKVENKSWTYDGNANAGSITVTYDGKVLAIGQDYTLTISKDGGTAVEYTSEDAAIQAMVDPGTYRVTATGAGSISSDLTDTETVTIYQKKPTVTVTVSPDTLSGGGTVKLRVEVSPDGIDLVGGQLTVTRGGSAYGTVTLADEGGGVYTGTFSAPNASATYRFTATTQATGEYQSVTASDTLTVSRTGGGGGNTGGGGSDPDEPDEPEEPDKGDPADTGVSGWLNTKDHTAFLSGYSDGSFRPDANMTRAEVAQMFYGLLLDQDVTITVRFADVSDDAWYARAVNTLASLGLVSGYSDGTFQPNRTITRAEFTAIAMGFAEPVDGEARAFRDVRPGAWYYDAVTGAAGYGWISGYSDGTFRPEKTITRAEVTAITNQMLGRAADQSYVNGHLLEIRQFRDLGIPHWAFYSIMEATNDHDYRVSGGEERWR